MPFDTDRFDQAVFATPGISISCSSSDWILPASETLLQPENCLIFEQDDCWIAFGESKTSGGQIWFHPLEFSWGFSCPLVGPSESGQESLLLDFASSLPNNSLVSLAGFSADSHLARILERFPYPLQPSHDFSVGTLRAHLGSGIEAYLSRRDENFRRKLDLSEKKIMKQQVRFQLVTSGDTSDALFNRLLSVEQRSWKFMSGESIFQQDSYADFYRGIAERTMASGRLRLMFASLDGRDIAYNFGGVFGNCFRGFQMSFDDEHRALGIGNMLQLRMIEQVISEGVEVYDFGQNALYKQAWADEVLELRSTLFRT